MKIFIDDGMRIGLNTGIGKYTKYLYESLKETKKVEVELSDFKSQNKNRIIRRILYLLHINSVTYYKKMGNYDIAHFTGQYFPFFKNKKTKYVATIHDIVSYKHPETMSRLSRIISKRKIRRIINIADVILTVSDSVRKEISEEFPKSKGKLMTVYPGNYLDVKRIQREKIYFSKDNLLELNNSPYFLFVGTIEKRKNIAMIINAYIKLRKQSEEANKYKLVLAGRQGYGFEEFKKLAKDAGYEKDIIFTGFITDDERNMLYSKADAYIFPSVYEGFGSTQLECMACHTPLILSEIPTNREVSSNYGLFFSLDDINSLIKQMEYIVGKRYDRQYYNSIADKILTQYNWKKLVDEYIEMYERVLYK